MTKPKIPHGTDKRSKDGRTDPAAGPSVLTDLMNLSLWRHALIQSPYPITEVERPAVIHIFDPDNRMSKYNQLRYETILGLSASRIAHYCRLYDIRIHNRPIPSYFLE